MNQQEVWDKIAEPWAKFRKKTPSEVEEFLQGKKGRVLDLGCGSGRNLIANPNIEYYGVDFSKNILKLAEIKAKQAKIKAIFLKADIGKEKLPFNSNFFNSAIFISTLHCLETPEQRKNALKELYRVMKKNGEVVISVWRKEAMIKGGKREKQNSENFDISSAKETFVNWKKDNKNYSRYYYFYSEKELEDLLKEIGFKIIKNKIRSTNSHSKKNIMFYIQK